MLKILPLVFSFAIAASPVFAWGEGGCSFSMKNKASQDATIEQFDNQDSSDK